MYLLFSRVAFDQNMRHAAIYLFPALGLKGRHFMISSFTLFVSLGVCLMLSIYALVLLVVFGKWEFYRDVLQELLPRNFLFRRGVANDKL